MFCKPRPGSATRHLFVGNCGPAVGLTELQVHQYFLSTGAEAVKIPGSTQGATSHVFVTYKSVADAETALKVLNDEPPAELGNRKLTLKFAEKKSDKQSDKEVTCPVYRGADRCNIPGLGLHTSFVSPEQEQGLLREVEAGPWETLARRRVQHFGYKFEYVSRNVDAGKPIKPLPHVARQLACRLEKLLGVNFDQLTVNEYEAGVGLSAHVDTHSAFAGPIVSLSLAGPCVMEFRRDGDKRALFLPPRSLLVMADEARYAWHHYIPHRRSDVVDGQAVPRAVSRVSFTFRKVRRYPCNCAWAGSCDSQGGGMPPTRMSLAAQGGSLAAASNSPACEADSHQEAARTSMQGLEQHQPCASTAPNHSTWNGDSHVALETLSLTKGSQHLAQQDAEGYKSRDAQDSHFYEHIKPEAQPPRASSYQPDGRNTGTQPSSGASADGQHESSQSSKAGQQMESRYVHGVYDIIAGHFSATRFAIWPKVREFIDSLPRSALVADVGCGNGKYFGVRPDLAVLGSDRSPNLAETAAKRLLPSCQSKQPLPRCDVAVADGLHLPYRSGSLDGVLCIAVLHHISTVDRRLVMLAELARVLRCGGRAIVTVWASEQEQPGKLAKWLPIGPGSQSGGGDYFVPWHVPFHRVEAAAAAAKARSAQPTQQRESQSLAGNNEQQAIPKLEGAGNLADDSGMAACMQQPRQTQDAQTRSDSSSEVPCSGESAPKAEGGPCPDSGAGSGLDVKDVFADGQVDRIKGTVVFKRYYHLYDKDELDQLVNRVPGVKLISSFFDKSNWCIVFQKE